MRALTFDDEILTGGTIVNAANALLDAGVTEVYCCATHPVFSPAAPKLLGESAFKEVVVTDSVPLTKEQKVGNLTVLSIAPLMGEAIKRIHEGRSVGELFQ
jgi:ribose-phosphate pyrophosphokinase